MLFVLTTFFMVRGMKLKIASYNIHKAVGGDGRRDPVRILNVLNTIDADIVVLQEADRRLGERPTAIPRSLIAQHTAYKVAPLARNGVSLGWHGNAILLRDTLNCDAAGHIELPGLEPRGAVFVELDGLRVVGTHLGLLRLWRLRQMKSILDHVWPESSKTLIAGDFNEWSDIRGTEPWENDFSVLYPGRSFPARRPVAALDGFAFGSSIASLDGGVLRDHTTFIASDHLPVWTNIEVNP